MSSVVVLTLNLFNASSSFIAHFVYFSTSLHYYAFTVLIATVLTLVLTMIVSLLITVAAPHSPPPRTPPLHRA